MRKIKMENVYFQEYLAHSGKTIPIDYHNDKVLKSNLLNRCVGLLNRSLLWFFHNFNNTPLQDKDTNIRREMYQAYEASLVKGNTIANSNDQQISDLSIRRLSMAVNDNSLLTVCGQIFSGKINKLSKLKDRHQQQQHMSQYSWKFPKCLKSVLALMVILQLFVYIHYITAYFILIYPSNKRLAITCSRELATNQRLVHVQEPVRIGSASQCVNQQDTNYHNRQASAANSSINLNGRSAIVTSSKFI